MNKISAFMDGEAGRIEAQQALMRLKQNSGYRETWNTFHLIGDAMRGDRELRDDFTERFHLRMEQEPTMLAPRQIWRKSASLALSAAASLAAIAVVFTLVLTDNPLNPQAQFATAPKSDVRKDALAVARPQPVQAANQGRVNEYLFAHQEFSPSTALQGVAPYVRTVSSMHDGSGQ